MQWFGSPWPTELDRAPICEENAMRVATPVGQSCLWCSEPIEEDDRGVMMPYVSKGESGLKPVHIECNFRQGVGGPAHILGRCTCSGGECDPDMGMTPREASRWVWEHWTGRSV